jgi:bacteriorhodopsin
MLIESTLFSIIFQIITGVIDIYGISLPVEDNYSILQELLQVELGVQVIELIFYIWLIYSIHSLKNITLYRYADWFITTPVMLVTLMAYLSIKPNESSSLSNFLKTNKDNVIYVVLLNAAMLLFGVLSEIIPAHKILFVAIGFIPFAMYFYKIYKDYLQTDIKDVHPVFTRKRLFWYFLIIWSLYGIVAFMPYVIKNIGLNILDLFSKNIFGIMLVYIISHHTTNPPSMIQIFENIFSKK